MQTIFPAPLEEINEELLRTGRWEGELITHEARRDAGRGGEPMVAAAGRRRRRPVAILETNNDITERKRAEESLRRE